MDAATPETLRDVAIGEGDALVIVDVQPDFTPGGPLAVAEGDAVIAPINRIARRFPIVVATQDWHPADHFSFASAHRGRQPFETVAAPYGDQTLWPEHCVAGTPGAALHPELDQTPIQMIVRKGFRREIDSYSAFFENDGATTTGLDAWLRARGARRLFFAGLATDFCVGWSVRDARRLGYESVLVEDACRAIDLDGSLAAALADMAAAGARRLTSAALAA
jgi:nicotinamidase/pyrazinamidase